MPFQNPQLNSPAGSGYPPVIESSGVTGNTVASQPGNVPLSITLNALATSGSGPICVNPQHRGITVFINVTAITGTGPSIVVTLNAVDPVSGVLTPLLASSSITAAGKAMLQVYPGIAVAANASANAVLPSQFQITYVIAGTTPAVTASIDYCLQT